MTATTDLPDLPDLPDHVILLVLSFTCQYTSELATCVCELYYPNHRQHEHMHRYLRAARTIAVKFAIGSRKKLARLNCASSLHKSLANTESIRDGIRDDIRLLCSITTPYTDSTAGAAITYGVLLEEYSNILFANAYKKSRLALCVRGRARDAVYFASIGMKARILSRPIVAALVR
jgi:hypothetical protein